MSTRADAATATTPFHATRVAASKPSRGARALDIGGVLLLAPAALLIGTITAIAIFLDSPGSVLYRSRRVGRGGREFDMLKFRKMRHAATGIPLTMHDDERFTPVGSFLAITKLDELPQLWNVLRGQMRLVGPRPEVPDFVSQYADAYTEILTVSPGITGPAAVEYASERHLLARHEDPMAFYREQLMPRKIAIDVAYVRQNSVLGDVRILVRTLFVPFGRLVAGIRRDAHEHHAHAIAMLLIVLALIAVTAVTGASQF
jgi:lipopolysaccharide/colanic/teichoic acid biosynthesis glycosyltransferase